MEPKSITGNSQNPVTVAGLDEMVRAFKELGENALTELQPAVNKAGDIVLAATRERVGRYTKYSQYHTLQRSLFLKRPRAKNGAYYNILTWGDDCRAYGAPLELGHDIIFEKRGKVYGRVPAHPFMRPAADESAEKVYGEITDAMDKILNNMGGLK